MMATYFAQASEILASEHWKALGVFAEVESSGGVRVTVPRPLYFVEDGADGEAPAPPPSASTPPPCSPKWNGPRLNRPRRTASRPRTPTVPAFRTSALAGVRILDLSWIAAGPAATNLLGCLGAEMIRLESAKRIDLVRFKGSIVIPGGDPERAPLFNALNFNKQGVVLNLKRPESLDIVYDLVKSCDAVIDNMRPGVMETLALGPDVLRQHNPTLVTVSASGFGPRGPQRDYPSIAPILGGSAGVSAIHRLPRRRPLHRQLPHRPAHGLDHRLRHHRGDRRARPHRQGPPRRPLVGCLDHDTVRAHLHRARPIGNEPWAHRQPASLDVAHGVFPSLGDEQWVTIAARTEEEWRALCDAMGKPSLADDPRFATMADRHANNDALEAVIGQWTAGLTNWEVSERLQKAGIAAMPSMSNTDDRRAPPPARARAFWECPHPVMGPVILPRPPLALRELRYFLPAATPMLGEHTHEVMTELLGYSEAETARLDDLGIFV